MRIRWREQAEINLSRKREEAAAAVEADEDGLEEYRRGLNGRLLVWGTGRGYKVV